MSKIVIFKFQANTIYNPSDENSCCPFIDIPLSFFFEKVCFADAIKGKKLEVNNPIVATKIYQSEFDSAKNQAQQQTLLEEKECLVKKEKATVRKIAVTQSALEEVKTGLKVIFGSKNKQVDIIKLARDSNEGLVKELMAVYDARVNAFNKLTEDVSKIRQAINANIAERKQLIDEEVNAVITDNAFEFCGIEFPMDILKVGDEGFYVSDMKIKCVTIVEHEG